MSDIIERLEELHAKATAGPWGWLASELVGGGDGLTDVITMKTEGSAYMTYETMHFDNEDADKALIVEARNALPALLAVAKAAKGLKVLAVAGATPTHPRHRRRRWVEIDEASFAELRQALAALEASS